jgi:hypothetical protein
MNIQSQDGSCNIHMFTLKIAIVIFAETMGSFLTIDLPVAYRQTNISCVQRGIG